MAYQQTTATSVEDLINKLATFATGLGWTVERNSLSGSNRTLSLKRASGDYVHIFNTDTTNLRLRASTGINTGVAVSSQPGVSTAEAVSNGGAGPFTNVFFFGGTTPAPYVHVVYDIGGAVLRHFHFGELAKIGSWTGGTFFDAMNVSTPPSYNDTPTRPEHHVSFSQLDNSNSTEGAVRCDFDGLTNNFAWITSTDNTANKVVLGGLPVGDRTYEGFFLSSINSWSGVTPLQPIKLRVERDAGFHSEIGTVPGIRYVNMSRWSAGDEFSIGPDTWKIFPWWRQGVRAVGDTTGAYSGQYAFAYLKTV